MLATPHTQVSEDLGAGAAALLFNLLLVGVRVVVELGR